MFTEYDGEFYWVVWDGVRVTDIGYFPSESEAQDAIESLKQDCYDAWAAIEYAHAGGYHN